MLLDLLLLGISDDGLQLVEALLHQREAEPRRLLFLPDSLQLPPAHLLGHAWTLLPLLDPLGEDLVDATGQQDGSRAVNETPSLNHHEFMYKIIYLLMYISVSKSPHCCATNICHMITYFLFCLKKNNRNLNHKINTMKMTSYSIIEMSK